MTPIPVVHFLEMQMVWDSRTNINKKKSTNYR